MSKLSQMASVCIFDHMMTGHTTVGEIVNCVFDKYPQEMSDPKLLRQLARAAVTKEVKRQLRNAVKDNEHVQGELQLPGDEPPRAISNQDAERPLRVCGVRARDVAAAYGGC